jgi:hypothetical protein
MDDKMSEYLLEHENKDRIAALEKLIESLPRLLALERRVDKIENGVCEIRDKLLMRPPWFVVLLITSLIALCSTLLTLVLKH